MAFPHQTNWSLDGAGRLHTNVHTSNFTVCRKYTANNIPYHIISTKLSMAPFSRCSLAPHNVQAKIIIIIIIIILPFSILLLRIWVPSACQFGSFWMISVTSSAVSLVRSERHHFCSNVFRCRCSILTLFYCTTLSWSTTLRTNSHSSFDFNFFAFNPWELYTRG